MGVEALAWLENTLSLDIDLAVPHGAIREKACSLTKGFANNPNSINYFH